MTNSDILLQTYPSYDYSNKDITNEAKDYIRNNTGKIFWVYVLCASSNNIKLDKIIKPTKVILEKIEYELTPDHYRKVSKFKYSFKQFDENDVIIKKKLILPSGVRIYDNQNDCISDFEELRNDAIVGMKIYFDIIEERYKSNIEKLKTT